MFLYYLQCEIKIIESTIDILACLKIISMKAWKKLRNDEVLASEKFL